MCPKKNHQHSQVINKTMIDNGVVIYADPDYEEEDETDPHWSMLIRNSKCEAIIELNSSSFGPMTLKAMYDLGDCLMQTGVVVVSCYFKGSFRPFKMA